MVKQYRVESDDARVIYLLMIDGEQVCTENMSQCLAAEEIAHYYENYRK